MDVKNEGVVNIPTRILVVDDEQGMRDFLFFDLGARGYKVFTAATCDEALAIMAKEPIDVVVSDLAMPKLNGLELLGAIKKISPKIEVILMTGYATVETALESMKRGAYDYITKPFQSDDLCRIIERALEKRHMNREIDQLQELNRLKSEFLATMSHELRTPMNAIIGYTSLILDHVYGDVPLKQGEALERVVASAKHLLSLINSVLDLSKLNAGMMPVHLSEFDLGKLVQEVVDTMQALAVEKDLSFTCSYPPGLIVRSDRTKVKQVLVNLAGNALKFTDRGCVSAGVHVLADGSSVEMKISDTGPGIDEKNIQMIFEEFTQLDGSVTRKHGGTGLGLSITKKIVELLGGWIHVESRLGAGSTFIFNLPGVIKLVDPKILGDLKPLSHTAHSKVLLAIDDDPEAIRLLRDSLTGSGYELAAALSGEEGVVMARQIKPDVITLDIMMPHQDGWSVLRLLKTDPELRDIPVIICSIIENRALGFSLGVSDYLVKPFDRRVLLDKLNALQCSQGKVLVVDDDPGVLEIFKTEIGLRGYAVRVAINGRQALELLQARVPDVLFLELALPDMSCFEILNEIDKNPESKRMRVIVLTDRDLSSQEAKWLEGRVDQVIRKGSTTVRQMLEAMEVKGVVMNGVLS